MTCIVGIVDNGRVTMAGDSAGVSGLDLMVRKDKKVFSVEQFMFGCTWSYRMCQILRYKFKPPVHHAGIELEEYMHTSFIDAVRATFRENGFMKVDSAVESGGEFLVAYRGHLFHVHSDFQVAESEHNFDAAGSGAALALGAMHATKGMIASVRLNLALSAAQAFNAGVREPFYLVHGRVE